MGRSLAALSTAAAKAEYLRTEQSVHDDQENPLPAAMLLPLPQQKTGKGYPLLAVHPLLRSGRKVATALLYLRCACFYYSHLPLLPPLRHPSLLCAWALLWLEQCLARAERGSNCSAMRRGN